MSQTSREIVRRCLTFERPERMPWDLWTLRWTDIRYPAAVAELKRRFPSDFDIAVNVYRPCDRIRGNPDLVGEFTDEWGCTFVTLEEGVFGEVRQPQLPDIADWRRVTPPYDLLPDNPAAARERVREYCGESDKFTRAACLPRPWERYQFIRGSQNALIDMADPEGEPLELLRRIHEFHLRELEFWVTTDVDSILFMDDWGAQSSLLISPATWREVFKPMYRDYCELARAHGKFVFMHSDGHIDAIFDDLVEMGVNALNSQIFCMDMASLARRGKGRITFWGEIDRQHVLNSTDPEVGRRAVREVARHLYDPRGGLIAMISFEVGAQPQTAIAVYEEWDKVQRENR